VIKLLRGRSCVARPIITCPPLDFTQLSARNHVPCPTLDGGLPMASDRARILMDRTTAAALATIADLKTSPRCTRIGSIVRIEIFTFLRASSPTLSKLPESPRRLPSRGLLAPKIAPHPSSPALVPHRVLPSQACGPGWTRAATRSPLCRVPIIFLAHSFQEALAKACKEP